jgi:hypothetical protein
MTIQHIDLDDKLPLLTEVVAYTTADNLPVLNQVVSDTTDDNLPVLHEVIDDSTAGDLPVLSQVISDSTADDLPVLNQVLSDSITENLPLITDIFAETTVTNAPIVTEPPVDARLIDDTPAIAIPAIIVNETPQPRVLSAEEIQQLLQHIETHLEDVFTSKLNSQLERLQHLAVDLAISELKAELPLLLREALTTTDVSRPT